ncbi:MAG: hypothetical protein ACKVRP_03040 [Bacteroidota bacterium]
MKHSTLLLVLLLGAFSCETTGPPPPANPQIQLLAIDASCTEAWLEIRLPLGIQPRSISLHRDTHLVLSTTLVATETTIVDEGLFPNRSYIYTTTRPTVSQSEQATVGVTTLDTTIHGGYTWSVDTLGDGNSSVLHDVAIVNDTLAIAVGRLSLRDTSGQIDPNAYSVAIWNGSSWSLQRLYYGGNNLIVPIRGVSVLGLNDIWLAAGSVFQWDGISSQTQLSFSRLTLPNPNATIEKLSLSTGLPLSGVGNVGAVVRKDGSSWQVMQSGTSVNLTDVSGNSSNSKVWAVGYQSDLSRSIVLEYDGQTWRVVRDPPVSVPSYPDSLSGIITSIWSLTGRTILAASSAGVYRFRSGSLGEAKRIWLPDPFSYGLFNRIRGNASNNAFVVGAFGTIAHFNGVSWHQYPEFFNLSSDLNLLGLAVKENMVVAVGYTGDRAIVIRGKKVNTSHEKNREAP